ncbi:HD domain-containing protein [Motilimonas sp. E26]|uniref:HD-GYP domain-containing protein n=1 Tax=Motilimonas sp. E26 TaxID=2865674 RepID=UPI001E3B3102|nr:HD domain-containing protein [Motilimonas sp. E26]MCE0558388.1 HD domain-containing protein [Motilimonas sp. E26]
MPRLKLSELISSLSYALDITEGQPAGHCIRCCWIGMKLGETIGLNKQDLWNLYYVLLLKDLGCSSNASRICELYLTDDLSFKREFKWVDGSLPQVLRFVLRHTGTKAGILSRFRAISDIFAHGDEIAQELIKTRCTRGADIARQLRFSEQVAGGIHALDEHWDGSGRPDALQGEQIPIYARIALFAQVVDVMHQADGNEAAISEASKRAGTWFDPALSAAFAHIASDAEFWAMLTSDKLDQHILSLEPGGFEQELDEDFYDDIAEAYGQVVDAKSPFTAGHSARVGLYSSLLAEQMGFTAERIRWIKRGALLHDVGKLGVSNSILDKPGKLTDEEYDAIKLHAVYTQDILGRIPAFGELAAISAAHHERLDGKGYPKGLTGSEITLESRIITTADIFDAITADRPYRGAIPISKTLSIMSESVNSALDPRCFDALVNLIKCHPELFPNESQSLSISAKTSQPRSKPIPSIKLTNK